MMRAAVFLLALAGTTFSLPTFSLLRRGLLNLSPVVSPSLGVGGDDSCLGIGVSVCDPITAGGTQSSSSSSSSTDQKGTDSSSSTSGSSDSLINISPVISPDVQAGGDNSCTGVGISACDPINVD